MSKRKVFISYLISDKMYFDIIKTWLEPDYISALTESDCIPAGMPIVEHIGNSISNSYAFVVIVSEHTRNSSYICIEIQKAIEFKKPIIVINSNGGRFVDESLCPQLLIDNVSLHIAFNEKILLKALKDWPQYYTNNIQSLSKAYYYKESVYNSLEAK